MEQHHSTCERERVREREKERESEKKRRNIYNYCSNKNYAIEIQESFQQIHSFLIYPCKCNLPNHYQICNSARVLDIKVTCEVNNTFLSNKRLILIFRPQHSRVLYPLIKDVHITKKVWYEILCF